MGRSVSYPYNAIVKAYKDVSWMEEDWDWQDFVYDIRYACKEAWPSLYDSDDWLGHEDRVLLENDFAYVGVSEYCGLACLWIVPKEDDLARAGLAVNWCNRMASRFKKLFGDYERMAVFSNGEAIYRSIR